MITTLKKKIREKNEVYIAKEIQSSAKHILGDNMKRNKVNITLRQKNLLKGK